MPKKQLDTLTEPMYYTLIALQQPRCGIEISEFVLRITQDRVKLVPGTLYTMLSKFEHEGMIEEIQVDGRKRTYLITKKGKQMLREEYTRLSTMIEEGKKWIEVKVDEIS